MPDPWFYVENGHTRGPIDIDSLSKMAPRGLSLESPGWYIVFAILKQALSEIQEAKEAQHQRTATLPQL